MTGRPRAAAAPDAMGAGSMVIVHLVNPREKVWGVLQRLDAVGAVVRGLDLNSVEDWIAQERLGREALLGPSTQFLPTHRIERIFLDERSGAAESYAERFAAGCGRDARDALIAGRSACDA